eukprot:scaffold15935_cov39-Tisochrysis_lutea.AAC.1
MEVWLSTETCRLKTLPGNRPPERNKGVHPLQRGILTIMLSEEETTMHNTYGIRTNERRVPGQWSQVLGLLLKMLTRRAHRAEPVRAERIQLAQVASQALPNDGRVVLKERALAMPQSSVGRSTYEIGAAIRRRRCVDHSSAEEDQTKIFVVWRALGVALAEVLPQPAPSLPHHYPSQHVSASHHSRPLGLDHMMQEDFWMGMRLVLAPRRVPYSNEMMMHGWSMRLPVNDARSVPLVHPAP